LTCAALVRPFSITVGAIGTAQRDSQILLRHEDREPFILNAFE
jgi:hypothetical protein